MECTSSFLQCWQITLPSGCTNSHSYQIGNSYFPASSPSLVRLQIFQTVRCKRHFIVLFYTFLITYRNSVFANQLWVCVCVCVWVRERKRDRKTTSNPFLLKKKKNKTKTGLSFSHTFASVLYLFWSYCLNCKYLLSNCV